MLIGILTPLLTFAADNPCKLVRDGQGKVISGSLPKCVTLVYTLSLGVGGLLAVFIVVWGGYLVMTAGGDAEAATHGKEYIASAVIGLALLFAAYLILQTINPELINFKPDLNFPDSSNNQFLQGGRPRQGGGGGTSF